MASSEQQRFSLTLLSGAITSVALSLGVPAAAQAPAPAAPAPAAPDASAVERADAAFEEGRELFAQGRFKEACDKFERSMQLDPSPGTLLNLGNCYEPQGDMVRALATFEQALAEAQHTSDPRRKELWSDAARERIASLSQRVPQLSVRGAPAGARVAIDGEVLDPAQGGALRINPGRHRVEVSAPGKRTFTRDLDVASGQRLAIDVPELDADPGAPVTQRPSSEALPHDGVATSNGPWPYVLGGTGVALLGTSLITGLMASSKAGELEDSCDGRNCAPALESTRDSAQTLALMTDIFWITGAITAGVGVTLFVLDQSDDESRTAVQAGCFGAGCGVLARGRF